MDVKYPVDKVLSQPTRARLFGLLAERKRPATTDELAEILGMHANGIRNHLETMLESGLVIRERERLPRGRPRDLWTIDPSGQPGGDPPTAYAELSTWLLRALEYGIAPDEIEELGREVGRGMANDRGGGQRPEARFHDALAAMGFQPSREEVNPEGITYCLNNCPYRDAAKSQQRIICGLHRGITTGLLESIEPESSLTGFVVKDPVEAGCQIRISGPLAARSA